MLFAWILAKTDCNSAFKYKCNRIPLTSHTVTGDRLENPGYGTDLGLKFTDSIFGLNDIPSL